MDLETLCSGIDLQPEMQGQVLRYYHSDDYHKVQAAARGLQSMETEAETRKELNQLFQTDAKHIKMLTCMLACAVELYPWYREKGISDTIFFETMRCFPRFIGECKQRTGEYSFDREWWTARQISGRLFRLGELEYEMLSEQGKPVVSMHIPSNAVLTPQKCDESIGLAKCFFAEHFPKFQDVDYVCDSWLLSPELPSLLPPDSNILAFQKRFQLQKADASDTAYIEWVFKTDSSRVEDYPEDSTLQRNMKAHLLSGGKIGSGQGVLIRVSGR